MEREIVWSDDSLRQLKKFKKKRPKLGEDLADFVNEFSERRLPGDEITNIGDSLAVFLIETFEHHQTDGTLPNAKFGGRQENGCSLCPLCPLF